MLILNSVQLFISFLSSNCLKKKKKSKALSFCTLTSDVSLWQFLQARDTEEKVRSAWSNFPPWKFRKNVVKGSCRSGGGKKETFFVGNWQQLWWNRYIQHEYNASQCSSFWLNTAPCQQLRNPSPFTCSLRIWNLKRSKQNISNPRRANTLVQLMHF